MRDLIEAGLNEPADAATGYGISAVALDLGRRCVAASFISGTDLLVDGGGTAGMKIAMGR